MKIIKWIRSLFPKKRIVITPSPYEKLCDALDGFHSNGLEDWLIHLLMQRFQITTWKARLLVGDILLRDKEKGLSELEFMLITPGYDSRHASWNSSFRTKIDKRVN